MAIGTPTSLATPVQGGAGSTLGITTTVTAPSDSLILAFGTWGLSTDRTGTMSGGTGLSWATDQSGLFDIGGYIFRVGMFSAPAAAGLPSGQTLTLTTSGSTDGRNLAVYYCTGLDLTSGRFDIGSTSGSTSAVNWTSGSASTTNPDNLLFGGSLTDLSKTSTATGGATELDDWANSANVWTATTAYQIVAAAGSQSLPGPWSGSNAGLVAGFAAYKASGGAASPPAVEQRDDFEPARIGPF